MKHLHYLRYILRHKLFVLIACVAEADRLGVGSRPLFAAQLLWRGLTHDLSKLRPSEWFPYVENFYGEPLDEWSPCVENFYGEPLDEWIVCDGEPVQRTVEQWERQDAFDAAWLFHQHRNRHHWQHWILHNDDGSTRLLPMPELDMLELLCDWYGAGWAITGEHGWPNVAAWYTKEQGKLRLDEGTRERIERFLRDRSRPLA